MSYVLYAAEVNGNGIDEVYYKSEEEVKSYIKLAILGKIKDIVNFHGSSLVSINADIEKYEIKYKVVSHSATRILSGSYSYKIVKFESQ